MIRLKDITVCFNDNTPYKHLALNELNLTIKKGEFIIVIGGNGAGKSTLMNVIAGSVNLSSGNIYIDNDDITTSPAYSRAKYISRVFQDPMIGTCSNLTIEENFALADMRGKKRTLNQALLDKNKKRYEDLVSSLDLGLETRMNEPIGLLSGGQRQVLSLLMATLQPTKLLLLDEHTAALDPKMGKKVIEITDKIIKKHKLTTLMITHDMRHAAELGTRTIVMRNGEIVHDLVGKEKDNTCPFDLWEETQTFNSPNNLN